MSLRTRNLLLLAWALLFAPIPAFAIPVLQLYIENSTYDATTQTWIVDSGTTNFRLWAIGNVNGPGGAGGLPIQDVRLSAAYDHATSDPAPTITLTPTKAGGTGTYVSGITTITDASLASGAGFLQTVTNGSSPTLGSDSPLPAHGIYGSGTDWQEWSLGNFTLTDSPIGDFINGFPSTVYADKGQINVYDVHVTGASNLVVHFDLYDHVGSANHVKFSFAPFSHDAEADVGTVPEPASLLLLGLGLAWLGFAARRWRRKEAAY